MRAEAEEVFGGGRAENCELLVGRVLESRGRQRVERQEERSRNGLKAALEQTREPRVVGIGVRTAAVHRVNVQLEQEEGRHRERTEQNGLQNGQEEEQYALRVAARERRHRR